MKNSIKAGLVTYHFSDNYGALFQAYGLRKWFLNQGVDASFLNYHPRYVEEGGEFDALADPKKIRKNLTIFYMKLMHLRLQVFGNKEQKKAFNDFRVTHLGISGERRFSLDELQNDVEGMDLLVCGSDQIWRPSIQKGLDPVYFLDIPIAQENILRVSYAPSFGGATFDSAYQEEACKLINKLDAVSIRESTGAKIVNQVAQRDAVVVPDPTILLGQFDELLADNSSTDNTIFCYALRTDSVIRDVAESVSGSLGGELISPKTSRQRWRDIGLGVRPGPVEWLRMIARANVVVSNSFHGIALSIVLNKTFIAVALPGSKKTMNSRTVNLLESVGLMDRFVENFDAEIIADLLDSSINWVDVNKRVAALRESGCVYLREQIVKVAELNEQKIND